MVVKLLSFFDNGQEGENTEDRRVGSEATITRSNEANEVAPTIYHSYM